MVLFRLYYLGLAPYENARHLLGLSETNWVNCYGTDPQPLRQEIVKARHVPAEEIFYVRGIIERENYAGQFRV